MNSEKSDIQRSQRKPYVSPVVTNYGDIVQLTLSTGHAPPGDSGNNSMALTM